MQCMGPYRFWWFWEYLSDILFSSSYRKCDSLAITLGKVRKQWYVLYVLFCFIHSPLSSKIVLLAVGVIRVIIWLPQCHWSNLGGHGWDHLVPNYRKLHQNTSRVFNSWYVVYPASPCISILKCYLADIAEDFEPAMLLSVVQYNPTIGREVLWRVIANMNWC